jgi:hypothetical protein
VAVRVRLLHRSGPSLLAGACSVAVVRLLVHLEHLLLVVRSVPRPLVLSALLLAAGLSAPLLPVLLALLLAVELSAPLQVVRRAAGSVGSEVLPQLQRVPSAVVLLAVEGLSALLLLPPPQEVSVGLDHLLAVLARLGELHRALVVRVRSEVGPLGLLLPGLAVLLVVVPPGLLVLSAALVHSGNSRSLLVLDSAALVRLLVAPPPLVVGLVA